jgi:phosphatidylserine decarboxylase
MPNIFQTKHELWLKMLFASFSIDNQTIKESLYDFALIQFRHMKWIATDITKNGNHYNYNREQIEIACATNFEMIQTLLNTLHAIKKSYPNSPLYERIEHDETYMRFQLEHFLADQSLDQPISAFDKKRIYPNKSLEEEELDALTLFLFEETYKEYELILTYSYAAIRTQNKRLSDIFDDLVYESYYHLKNFAQALSHLGILSIPRVVMERVYQFDDLTTFLKNGIDEEISAKDECKRLAAAIKDPELSHFFNFINHQESYHIELMREALHYTGLDEESKSEKIKLTPLLLTNMISRGFGKFASFKFPTPVQSLINKTYVKLLKLDMMEFDTPQSYPSLNALFTRKLEIPRKFDKLKKVIISPVDAKVSACGDIQEDQALQIKGHSYSVTELLTSYIDPSHTKRIENGKFINFYLSPKDYHRYHAPIDITILKAIHVPAVLYPVNFPTLKRVESLFVKNERVILECLTNSKKLIYLVFVGALNVGQMRFIFDERIETNIKTEHTTLFEYQNLKILKGEELGYFKMGSTVVMLAQEDLIEIETSVDSDVKFAQTIGKIV